MAESITGKCFSLEAECSVSEDTTYIHVHVCVYKEDWDPSIGERFLACIEKFNKYGMHEVAFIGTCNGKKIVGHVPIDTLKICYNLIKKITVVL